MNNNSSSLVSALEEFGPISAELAIADYAKNFYGKFQFTRDGRIYALLFTEREFMIFCIILSVGGGLSFGLISGILESRSLRKSLQQLRKIYPTASMKDLRDYRQDPQKFLIDKNLLRAGDLVPQFLVDIQKANVTDVLSKILSGPSPIIKQLTRQCFNKIGLYRLHSQWQQLALQAIASGAGQRFHLLARRIYLLRVESFLSWLLSRTRPETWIFRSVLGLHIYELSMFKVLFNLATVIGVGFPIPFQMARIGYLFAQGTLLPGVAKVAFLKASLMSLFSSGAYMAGQFIKPNCEEIAQYVDGSSYQNGQFKLPAGESISNNDIFLANAGDEAKGLIVGENQLVSPEANCFYTETTTCVGSGGTSTIGDLEIKNGLPTVCETKTLEICKSPEVETHSDFESHFSNRQRTATKPRQTKHFADLIEEFRSHNEEEFTEIIKSPVQQPVMDIIKESLSDPAFE